MKSIGILTRVSIIIALFYLTYAIYFGHIHPLPQDGDSWDYHMPIAYSIINGGFLTANFNHIPLLKNPVTGHIHPLLTWYYPGSSEAINAIFVLFHIPTFSNIFAAIILFFCCFTLAKTFSLTRDFAILFGITVTTLNIILRWLNVVSIDTWIGVWFTLSIVLLENPKKNIKYFAQLGFVIGMLMGSKFSGFYFIAVLFIFYIRNIFSLLNLKQILSFLVPFSIFGLFWYIRNYIVAGSPFYPIPAFGFDGPYKISSNPNVFIESIRQPLGMFNAVFGEYHMWMFSILVALCIIIYQYGIKREYTMSIINKIFFIGLLNIAIYFTLPTNPEPWIMVSSLRYSYPAFIPLILGIFLFAAKYNKEELIGYIVIANMLINVLTTSFYPKLIFFYLPAGLIIIYFLDKHKADKQVKIAKAN